MIFQRLLLVFFFCLSLNLALAQDPTKTESQHYKLAFENEWVQVVDVHYGPHEKSGMHDHPGGVVVVITGGHLRFTEANGSVRDVYAKPGESRWFPAFKHKVENLGDTAYNAVYIGIKAKTEAAGGQRSPMDPQTAKILQDYVLARQKP